MDDVAGVANGTFPQQSKEEREAQTRQNALWAAQECFRGQAVGVDRIITAAHSFYGFLKGEALTEEKK